MAIVVGQRTLDLEHNHVLARLKARRGNANDLRRKINTLNDRIRALESMPKSKMSDADFDELKWLTHKVSGYKNELDGMDQGGSEIDYYMRTAPILFKYYEIIDKGGGGGSGGSGCSGCVGYNGGVHDSSFFGDSSVAPSPSSSKASVSIEANAASPTTLQQKQSPQSSSNNKTPTTASSSMTMRGGGGGRSGGGAPPPNSILNFFKRASSNAANAVNAASSPSPVVNDSPSLNATNDAKNSDATTTAQQNQPNHDDANNNTNNKNHNTKGSSYQDLMDSIGEDRAMLLEKYVAALDSTMPSRYVFATNGMNMYHNNNMMDSSVTASSTTTLNDSVSGGIGGIASLMGAGGVGGVGGAGLGGSGGKKSVSDSMGVREPPPAPATVSRGAAFLASSSAANAANVESSTTETCLFCGHVGARTLMLQDGYVYCPKCNSVEYILVDHDKPSYKDPPKEIAYFAYKRINHFNEWLNQVQGKETTEIPEEIYDSILLEVKKRKINNMAVLTCRTIKAILKKLKANKYYEHAPHILMRLNGMPSPHIPPELEERLRHMFCTIQLPFLKHAPLARKNFLSYSYCLHKMMQLLERDEYLSFFPLLKAREKLSAQDAIWKKICADVGWDFIPSL